MLHTILFTLRQLLQDACPFAVRTAHTQQPLPNRITEPFLVLDLRSLHAEKPLTFGASVLRYPFTAEVTVLLAAPLCCDTAELQALLSRYVLPPLLQAGCTVTTIACDRTTDRSNPFPELHTLSVAIQISGVYTTTPAQEGTGGEAAS